jgi:5'-deoxy-5'-methylthioadenosine phosphorylase
MTATGVAIIGGSGLTNLNNLEIIRREVMRTPYGEPSGPMVYGRLKGKQVVFLPRHGPSHTIPPHQVNYRANIWALKHAGIERIIAVAAVGGIADDLQARDLVFPDQIVDYTYGRAHTFFDGEEKKVTHVDFSYPYCPDLRRCLAEAARYAGIAAVERGTYGATQGPRFETAAEIRRMERDGADVVGMTGMPEAALARELDIRYATIAVVVNRAAGKEAGIISLKEIEAHLEAGMAKVRRLLESAIPLIAAD